MPDCCRTARENKRKRMQCSRCSRSASPPWILDAIVDVSSPCQRGEQTVRTLHVVPLYMGDPREYAGHIQRLIEGTGSRATGVTAGAAGPKRFAGREAVAFGPHGKHRQQPFELRALACGTHG